MEAGPVHCFDREPFPGYDFFPLTNSAPTPKQFYLDPIPSFAYASPPASLDVSLFELVAAAC